LGTLICWATLVVGSVLLVLDAKMGAGWKLAGGGLAFFALVTAANL
jgi:hypothetical protein